MISALQIWFNALSLREKLMIAAAAALSAVIILIFLIGLPLLAAIETKQQEYVAALDRRARVEARIENLATAAPAADNNLSGSLQSVISQSAAEAGFALDRADPAAADGLEIAMAKARPKALMTWLNDWEARGIVAEQVDIKAGTDGTVSVTALLKRSGR